MSRSLPRHRFNLLSAGIGDDLQAPPFNSAPCAFDREPAGWPSVSMATGEVLLRLSDGVLDGPLAFEWTRRYCSGAVETASELGFGWTHALCHRLHCDGQSLLWTDPENRETRFPRPVGQRPDISACVTGPAIYRGDSDGELILAPAARPRHFYHFQDLELSGISDAYGNRLSITWHTANLRRIDNGAGRALLLRHAHGRLCAVDYQQYDDSGEPGDTLTGHNAGCRPERWSTLFTLVTYQYNDSGQLISASNALQETEHYRYDARHVIQERQLAGGAALFWEWQHCGKHSRCIRHSTNFGQMQIHYERDGQGAVTAKSQDGSQQTWVYDNNGRLVSQTGPDGAQHQKSYDEQGRLIAEIDPLGAVIQYRYNPAGQLSALIPPHDEPTFYSYCNGYLHSVRQGPACWRYERNAQGDITRQTDPDGCVTTCSYTPKGQISSIVQADGSAHRLIWNALGQLLEHSLPDGSQQRYSYDLRGRKTARQNARGVITRYHWDAVGRMSQIIQPDGKTRAWSYNAYGKVTAVRDERGHITRYEYLDNLPLPRRRINPDASQVNYRYDNGRLLLTGIENQRNEHYQLDYYPNGLLRLEIGFDGGTTGYKYDLNGQLLEKTQYPTPDYPDQPRLITAYQRDSAGRLLLKTLPDGSQIRYSYDSLGRLTRVHDGDRPLIFQYDLQDRLITEHQGQVTLRYQYDAQGRLRACQLPDGNRLTYYYRQGAGLTAIDLNGECLTSHCFDDGRETDRQQGDLLSHYQYDRQGRMQEHVVTPISHHHGFAAQALYRRTYQYDPGGNLRLLSDSRKGQHSFAYDPLNRLIAIRGHAEEYFDHDPAGNLLRQSASGRGRSSLANVKANRLLIQGDCHFVYDAYGNLIQERRGAGQRLVRQYRYDCQHRLSALTLPDGNEIKYRYDPFGRRIAKQLKHQSTEFIWQGQRLIAECTRVSDTAESSRYRSYLYEPGTGKPLAMLQGKGPRGEIFYYQLDPLGMPLELTGRKADIVWSAHYRAYGKVQQLDIADISNPLRVQGQYHDEESGLHYHRHRYYNPHTGRYLTPDPDKLAGGLNSYRYKPDPRQDCSRADSPWEPGRAKASTASISDPALPVPGTGPGQNP